MGTAEQAQFRISAVLMPRSTPWPKACRFGRQHTWMVGKDKTVKACGTCGRVKGHDDVQVRLGQGGWLVDLPAALALHEKRSESAEIVRLDPDDHATLVAALADPDLPGSDLARALSSQGHAVKGNTIQRHRRGDCTCEGGGA